jgi:putative phosphoesterase
LYRVNFGLDRLALLAAELQAEVVLFGHTHIATLEKTARQVFLNPGSITQPRGVPFIPTYATVTFSGNQMTVKYLTRQHEVLDELTQTLSLSI